jgi:2-dehydro-3-deoxyphosphogluconate aldolase / (4S)-4-hydroxy-2-oxoglutarate aldolase
MDTASQILNLIQEQGILPLYFNSNAETSKEILRTLYQAGIRAVEYTNRGEAAVVNFKELIQLRDRELPGMYLGIGTIKNIKQAMDYRELQADFFISPGMIQEVADYCQRHHTLYAPGCMTPTEIIAAENAGLRFIKLFPGNLLGPEFLASIRDIFPKLLFMPTGGVDTTQENLEAWFKAGVCAVGMGSKLISKPAMENKAYDQILTDTIAVMQTIQSIKKK